jgi:ABC-type polysaccharide transport system permease subunit
MIRTILFLSVTTIIFAIVLTKSHNHAMTVCQETMSYDTCFYSLNR